MFHQSFHQFFTTEFNQSPIPEICFQGNPKFPGSIFHIYNFLSIPKGWRCQVRQARVEKLTRKFEIEKSGSEQPFFRKKVAQPPKSLGSIDQFRGCNGSDCCDFNFWRRIFQQTHHLEHPSDDEDFVEVTLDNYNTDLHCCYIYFDKKTIGL